MTRGVGACAAARTLRPKKQRHRKKKSPVEAGLFLFLPGGASRSRTGLNGFAGRCITALLSRRKRTADAVVTTRDRFLSDDRRGHQIKREAWLPMSGAGDESRTRDLNLGKVALYQLSYSRIVLHAQRLAVQRAAENPWSGRRVSNSRPQPWQGCALPTELLPRCPACAASCRTTRCRKSWSGRRVSNSRPQPWQGCALPTELLPRIALPLLRHRYFVVQRRSEIMSKAHSRVKGFSRPFSKNFRRPPRATRITRRCARESAATRASCSTASTRSSGWPPDTSATRPTRACRSSRRRAAAARSTAASESRPSGTQS